MQSFREYLNALKTNSHMRQCFSLMFWNLVGIPLGIVTNIVITRYMGADSFGDYLYIQRVFELAFILLGFGVVQSLNRVVLLAKDDKHRRQLFGSGLICLFGVYIIICCALYVVAFVSPNFRDKGILNIFLLMIPFSIVFYVLQYLEQVLPSCNKINWLIIQRYTPRVGFFLIGLFVYFFVMKRNLSWNPVVVVWSSFLLTQLIVYLYVLRKMKPSFTNVKCRIQEIKCSIKEYGRHVYIGNLFSTAFAALMPVILSMVSETNSNVGFYSLSCTLSSPLSFIPIVIATSHYQQFASYASIPRKLLLVTCGISIFALVVLWALIGPFISFFYTEEFLPVIALTFITSIGTLLYGISDFFSRFLMAKGMGKLLRNSSFIVGFTTFMCSLIMIPLFHAIGAAITNMMAGVVYLVTIVLYYKKCIK